MHGKLKPLNDFRLKGALIYWQSLNLELRKTGKCTKPAHFLIP